MGVYEDELGCADTEVQDYVFSERFEKKMKKLVKKQRRPWFRFVSTSGRRAACAAAAVLVLSASSMSAGAVRSAFFGFISNVFGDHNEVLVDDNGAEGYPEAIEEVYEIEVPDEFELEDHTSSDDFVLSGYRNGENYILFDQWVVSHYKVSYDNERAVYSEYKDDDGQKYIVVEIDDCSFYIWNNGRYVFQITSNLDKESVLKICISAKCRK